MAGTSGLVCVRKHHKGFESVRFHGLESQGASIGFSDVNGYGEALTRSGYLLIETKAALPQTMQERFRRPGSIVLDGYGDGIASIGGDGDTFRGPLTRVVQEISKKLGQIILPHGHGSPLRDVDPPIQEFSFRGSPKGPDEPEDDCLDAGPCRSKNIEPLKTHTRQLAIHMPFHRVREFLDLVGDVRLSVRAQPGSIGKEDGQRRLKAVGQIGGARLCVFHRSRLRIRAAN